ncbi:hypothetical protein [Rhizobium sp. L1K21]|uniref:hypothetical protein n=1 Tax=Rhizobium sp. L1K21 TaxID=2954933 RepID=UPI002092454C|nr:hypothetical protein [Rhizobium sp. L1K21]MCO6184931.1 hypothetical protein [Rhizobium sp. L1K21]
MKIKIRVSRKVVIILSAATVLFGASGAAALYLGRDAILGPSKESIYGLECQDVVRIADVRGRDIPWLRKYIRVSGGDAETRLKTALRVAKHMEETLPAELIHVAVLAEDGPTVRAQMRGRAFGAEVFIFPDPTKIPGETEEYQGYYYEGSAADDGIFYGNKHALSAHALEDLTSAMTDHEYMTDCKPPEDAAAVAGETTGHGGSGEAEASSGHGAAEPAAEGGHGAAAGEGHGEESDGHAAAEEPGMFGKMLSFVGLGSSEPSEEGHAAAPEGGAAGEHGGAAEKAHGGADGETSDNGGHGAAAEGHEGASESATAASEHGGEPESALSFFDKMKNMVGLGSEDTEQPPHAEAEPHAGAGAPEAGAHSAGDAEDVGHQVEPGGPEAHSQNDGAASGHGGVDAPAPDQKTHAADQEEHGAVSDGVGEGHGAQMEEAKPAESAAHADEGSAVEHAAVAEDDSNPNAHAAENHTEVEDGALDNAWEGSPDGQVVVTDGPSDALMLGWEDDTLDAPAESDPAAAEKPPHGLVKSVVEQEIDPAPVSAVKGNADAAFH